jgi:hypothetical protein
MPAADNAPERVIADALDQLRHDLLNPPTCAGRSRPPPPAADACDRELMA